MKQMKWQQMTGRRIGVPSLVGSKYSPSSEAQNVSPGPSKMSAPNSPLLIAVWRARTVELAWLKRCAWLGRAGWLGGLQAVVVPVAKLGICFADDVF